MKRFNGIFSIEENLFIISHINSLEMGNGEFHKLVNNLVAHGYNIKVESPFFPMRDILLHLRRNCIKTE